MKVISCLLAVVLLAGCIPMLAQVSTSSITGTIQDASGAVIPTAKVTAKNEATGIQYSMDTTSAGAYSFNSVPPGQYTITVSKDGFRTYTSSHNVLEVGAPLVVNVTMEVGASGEVIQVESTYERLDTTSASLGDVVNQKEVVSLPLNGRNPLSLITLEPGLVQRPNSASGTGTHVFGSRNAAHNITIDGIDANESTNPNPQNNLYRLNPDNVQEFRVVTHNATAEFGRNSGANVTIATKSGGNALHGSVYYFHRNTVLNANEWFNNATGQERPTLLLHQFGSDVGGPIQKDKTFWFFSYQGNRIMQTQPIAAAYGVIPLTYSPSLRSGQFRYFVRDPNNPVVINGVTITRNSPLLVDPATGALRVPTCATPTSLGCVQTFDIGAADLARVGGLGIDPAIAALFSSLPRPNNYATGDGLNFAGVDWNPSSKFLGPHFMVRLDHRFNDSDYLFGRIIWNDFDVRQGDFINSRPAVFPGFPAEGENRRNGQNAAISYRHMFSPQMVNEFTVGFSRFQFWFPQREVALAQGVTPLDYAQDCFGTDSFRTVQMPFCNTPHSERGITTPQFIDNLSYVRGSHTFRTGLNVRLYRHNDDRGAPGGFNMWPTIIFDRTLRLSGITPPTGMDSTDTNNLQNAMVELLGMPARVQQVYQANLQNDTYEFVPFRLHTRAKQFNAYLQDEWKVFPTLTLNYGVRWELNLAPTDAGGSSFVPDSALDGSQGPVTYVKSDSWYKNNNETALAPRLGVAWNPGNGKTVIRAGGGVAFDTISTFQVTAMGGKVPGSVQQCRVNVGASTTPGGCQALPTPYRLSPLLAAINPFSLAIPTAAPSSQFSPAPAANGVAPNVGAFDPNMKLPSVYEWSLSVQRELPWLFVAQVGYVGKHGSHLLRGYDLNQIDLTPAYLQSFGVAQNNLTLGCRADGTNCPTGVTGTLPTLLWQLAGGSTGGSTFLNSSSSRTDLQRNGAADMAVRLDQNVITTTNQAVIVANGFPANYFRPNAQFSQIFFMDSKGNSDYHGMVAEVRRRFEKGLEFGLAYTFSKSIDDLSIDPVGSSSGGGLSTTGSATPTNIHNWRLDRAVSDFDNTHTIVSHLVYELPFGRGRRFASALPGWLNHIVGGWMMTGIFNYQSGEPFTVYSGIRTVNSQHTSRATVVGDKPDTSLKFVPGIEGPVVFQPSNILSGAVTCLSLVDSSSQFCIPAPGQDGGSRNSFRGPGFWNLDSGLSKQFDVTERFKIQLRAEFFNVLNHANFENPRNASDGSPSITSSLFGQTCCSTTSLPSSATVIATGEPNRVIQFGLKLTF